VVSKINIESVRKTRDGREENSCEEERSEV